MVILSIYKPSILAIKYKYSFFEEVHVCLQKESWLFMIYVLSAVAP